MMKKRPKTGTRPPPVRRRDRSTSTGGPRAATPPGGMTAYLCFGAPACRVFPDHLITYLPVTSVPLLLTHPPAFDTIRQGGPTRTSADVSVPRLAGFSLIT